MSSTPDDAFQRSFDNASNSVSAAAIISSIVGVISVIGIIAIAFACYRKRKIRVNMGLSTDVEASARNSSTQSNLALLQPVRPQLQAAANNSQQLMIGGDSTMRRFIEQIENEKPVRFTAGELCVLTEYYSHLLGSGGFGKVYLGKFPNGVRIAVKILKRTQEKEIREKQFKVDQEQFMAEVGTIGRTYHINLVQLYGFCYDQSMIALVYEFMENGSLSSYIFDHPPRLSFEKLYEIAVGVAKGMAYLHEECKQRIIHYDIKPENILLDENLTPKIADFGLARLCSRTNTHVTGVWFGGTKGYMAPELQLMNHPATLKCDVYSFGMVLFEIVRRRRNADYSGELSTVRWFPKDVWDKYERDELESLTRDCGVEEKDEEKAKRMCGVALWCAQDSPSDRPLMSQVVKMLEGRDDISPPPKPFKYAFPSTVDPANMLGDSSGTYSSYTSSDETVGLKNTTIMRKHEIQFASC